MNATGTQTRIALKNILYATDFSPAAESALPYVLGLARDYGAKVYGLHVRMPYPYIVGPEAVPQVIEAAEEQAHLEAQQLHEMLASVPHVATVIESGLWTAISETILKQNIDLIVIGTRGRSGMERALLGSAAEKIFRHAPCPVLTVGPCVSTDTERRLKMKEILFATDFSPESLGALPYAISMAQEHQARLTILHVIGEPKAGEVVHAEHYVESIKRRLREMVPGDAQFWCEPNCRVERGAVAEKILEVAVALGADLIVLGVRDNASHTGAAATHLFRLTAHQVVTQAECPVLTVRG